MKVSRVVSFQHAYQLSDVLVSTKARSRVACNGLRSPSGTLVCNVHAASISVSATSASFDQAFYDFLCVHESSMTQVLSQVKGCGELFWDHSLIGKTFRRPTI